ncbi:MAG: hypothetical protein K2N00_06510 [Lachnospiraceae bacterium]|nr:hypothetical protein [Lachnospiraceae bacterium]
MEKNISIRILLLKNNLYQDAGCTCEKALGEYCVLGYFDAFDISDEKEVNLAALDTWGYLGEKTSEQDSNMNCRMLVCVTEQQKEDREFWTNNTDPLVFITMIRLGEGGLVAEGDGIFERLTEMPKRMGYLSYDHSEIIVVTKTNQYSDGMKSVRELRSICNAVKTYTVFGIKEDILDSYETIKNWVKDEIVCCRLRCMVKNYEKMEGFRKVLEEHVKKRNADSEEIEIRQFEMFGGYDWLIEFDNISICSFLELYKTKELLTHANGEYSEIFFNIESEILIQEGK